MAYLVLMRHGESKWNSLGKWTGRKDIVLTPKGREEARHSAELLKNIDFDIAFVSHLRRAKETLHEVLNKLGEEKIPIIENKALNERDYGYYTGENKWQLRHLFGLKKFLKIRRSWDYPIPHGETLKDVYDRVEPFYEEHILPRLKKGENVLVVAHGNSLRALIKHLEHITVEDIPHLEMQTGEVYLYEVNSQGKIVSKQIGGAGHKMFQLKDLPSQHASV